MIDEKTKMKLIKELGKEGNVLVSCTRVGIDRSTTYRWAKQDKKFSKEFKEAIRMGRANACDIAEHSLMINVKKGKTEEIKYVLSHNHPQYKPKKTKVLIEHKKITDISPVKPMTYEDLIDDYKENGHDRALILKEQLTQYGKKIPNKPDGSPIEIHELYKYQTYIRDWQDCEEKKKREKAMQEHKKSEITPSLTDTADSKSSKDKLEVKPQENHTTQDTSHSDSSNHHTPPDSNK